LDSVGDEFWAGKMFLNGGGHDSQDEHDRELAVWNRLEPVLGGKIDFAGKENGIATKEHKREWRVSPIQP
jgi:hypothetical protein